MRIAPLALAALLFAGTAAAQEYTPPRILITGEVRPDVTEQSVTEIFVRETPDCVAKAEKAENTDPTRTLKSVQDAVFARCMTDAFAHLGLSAVLDAPPERLSGT